MNSSNYKATVLCLVIGAITLPLAWHKGVAAGRKPKPKEHTYLTLNELPSSRDFGTCAQTAEAIVLSIFDIPIPYDELSLQDIDRNGTSPFQVEAFLNSRVGAISHQSGSFSDLRASIDAGHPPVLTVTVDGRFRHMTTAIGYSVSPQGRLTHIHLFDRVYFARFESAYPLAALVPIRALARDWDGEWIEPGSKFRGNRRITKLFISSSGDQT